MFESIEGLLKEKDAAKAVIETHGIGYRIQIPASTYACLPQEEKKVFLYLCQVVREDAHTLYGFFSRSERELFETLLTISGIGPKTALTIVGNVDMGTLQQAVSVSDIRLLSKIPGIGKKTAERLVIEMRDKFKLKQIALPPSKDPLESDAMAALLHLGYTPLQAQKAVQAVLKEGKVGKDLSQLISASLQKISS